MTFDAAAAVRMLNNDRMRRAQGWCAFRDLGGALAATSDAPIPDLNCIEDFSTDERNIDALLDLGFALLRAFDCAPAALVTPIDRPESVAKRLRGRGLAQTGRRSWMAFRGDAGSIRANADVDVRVAEPDDATTFAALHGGNERWVKKLSLSTTLSGMLEPGNTFYLGYVEGQPVATLHLLCDGPTAGIYAVGTAKAFRRRGVSTTMMARAIRDAGAAGCDVVCLSTEAGEYAEALYAKMGFERSFESEMWVARERI